MASNNGRVQVSLRLRGDNETEGRNMLQNFREKTEGILRLEGSVNERTDETHSVNYQGEEVTKKVVNINYILSDPDFAEYEVDDELDEATIERWINHFYKELETKRSGDSSSKAKIRNLV